VRHAVPTLQIAAQQLVCCAAPVGGTCGAVGRAQWKQQLVQQQTQLQHVVLHSRVWCKPAACSATQQGVVQASSSIASSIIASSIIASSIMCC
jgi:hypothetical protein